MIAGIAAVVKALKPHIKVIGVEPTGANAMAQVGAVCAVCAVCCFKDYVFSSKQLGRNSPSCIAWRRPPLAHEIARHRCSPWCVASASR